jgi:PHD/YefM family antitoxin component YafN of YafNO toxin-antitoxin module
MAEVKTIDIQQAKERFETLVRDSSRHKAQWIVQEKGVSLAVIVSMDDYEDMLETVAELADPEYLASIQEARAQYQAGEVDTIGAEEQHRP